MQPKAFQPRSDSVKGAINGFVHPSILPFGNKVCTSAFSISTMKNAPAEGVRDPSARVSPAELPARGRDEVTDYGGEIIATEEDDL
ncbi:hypothetical protein AB0M44_34375 [Streptosporangium subroseum]|uniref:hypothetical protein n=1 Tax=Streptosporangium subroseum TaxID=106412 RepID=UPI003413EF50